MRDDSEAYVGLDTSKLKISVAVAEAGRGGEVRFLGEIDSAPEADPGHVFAEVLRIRPQAWPNLRIVEMGDALLGRGGALVEAARGVYRRQLGARPHLAEEFRRGGRGREVEAAARARP